MQYEKLNPDQEYTQKPDFAVQLTFLDLDVPEGGNPSVCQEGPSSNAFGAARSATFTDPESTQSGRLGTGAAIGRSCRQDQHCCSRCMWDALVGHTATLKLEARTDIQLTAYCKARRVE
jgi:hypothetical protein